MMYCKIESGKGSKTKSLLVIISILIATLSLNIIFIGVYNSYFKSEHLLNTTNEYRLVDLEQSTSSFIRNYNKINSLKQFNKEISSNNNFVYYEAIVQPTNIIDFKGTEKFLYNYEENIRNALHNSDSSESKNVKQLLINYNFAQKIKLDNMLINGNPFSTVDFLTDNYQDIPIVLGYDYVGIYEVGDIINCMPQKDIESTFIVIGFLDKDSSVMVNNELIFLDRYILSPSLTITKEPSTMEEMMYQGFLYLQKSNGVVKLSNGYEFQTFLSDLEKLRIKYNIFDIGILNYSMLELNTLKLLVYENIKLLIFLGISALLFNVISIMSHMIILVKSSFYTYKVYLLSGYSTQDIKKSIWIKLLILIAIPIIISLLIVYVFLAEFVSVLLIFNTILFCTLFLCTFTLINLYLGNISMDKLIKGDYND